VEIQVRPSFVFFLCRFWPVAQMLTEIGSETIMVKDPYGWIESIHAHASAIQRSDDKPQACT
jgi:hypothetical protein